MGETFEALVLTQKQDTVQYTINTIGLDSLSPGEVVVEVAYSSLNYKDMLAFQPNGGVVKQFPMIPGIDFSGVVLSSQDHRFKPGDEVFVTGYGTGVSHTGGLSQRARVPADWLIKMPTGLSLRGVMILGTAGLTAALSVTALVRHGITPADAIVVTGASGGVGSIAVALLHQLGYQDITAIVRRPEQVDLVKTLGAIQVIYADDFMTEKPLAKAQYQYGLDTVGGDVLTSLLAHLQYDGAVTACGNAAGSPLHASVLPFILRGVTLQGIDSVQVSYEQRMHAWQQLAEQAALLKQLAVDEVTLEEVPDVVDHLKRGGHVGRTIVRLA